MNCLIFDDHPWFVWRSNPHRIFPHIAQVNVASELKAANEFIRKSNIDLLILDVNLNVTVTPDYRRIKAHGFRGRVVFYSAETSADIAKWHSKWGLMGMYVSQSITTFSKTR